MNATLASIRRLWAHVFWADREVLRALEASGVPPVEALRELAHLVATEEVWLARLERRERRYPVWPKIRDGVSPPAALAEIGVLVDRTHLACERFLDALGEDDLGVRIDYVTSAGDAFVNTVGEILVHVALHGQYHRGKVNLLLRKAGLDPAPTDFIAYVRGAPAATEEAVRRGQRTPRRR